MIQQGHRNERATLGEVVLSPIPISQKWKDHRHLQGPFFYSVLSSLRYILKTPKVMWVTPLGRNGTAKDVHGRTDWAMVRKAIKLAGFRPFDHFQVEAGFPRKEGSYKPGAPEEE